MFENLSKILFELVLKLHPQLDLLLKPPRKQFNIDSIKSINEVIKHIHRTPHRNFGYPKLYMLSLEKICLDSVSASKKYRTS